MNKTVPKSLRKPLRKLGSLLVLLLIALMWAQTSEPPAGPSQERPIRLYDRDLRRALVAAIDRAEREIDLWIYGLTDAHVIQALNRKAEAGVTVRLLYDSNGSPRLKGKLHPAIRSVGENGKGLMHRKVLVVDAREVWIGSANMTGDSLHLHGNLMAGVWSAEFAEALTHRQAEGAVSVGGSQLAWYLLPEASSHGLARLIQLIDSARKTVCVAMFTWTHPDLTDAIIRAHARGIHVELVLDHNGVRGASKVAAERLARAGIDIAASDRPGLLHHKMAWIDGEVLVLGSANWTRAAFGTNRDLYMVLTELPSEETAYIRSLWKKIYAEARAL